MSLIISRGRIGLLFKSLITFLINACVLNLSSLNIISKIERGNKISNELFDERDIKWNEFYNDCELDIISSIFDNYDEENMNKEDIKRLIEEEKIYRDMREHYEE